MAEGPDERQPPWKPRRRGGPPQSRWGFRGKTFWNWLELLGVLAIPLVIFFGGMRFAAQQEDRQQAIEEQRAESERNIEEQRAQDAALQAYLDQMSQLMIENKLRDSEEDSVVRVLARARTLTVLERLGPLRKPILIRFLYESDLINRENRVIGLEDANLTETDFTETNPDEPRLNKVYLTGAVFDGANMAGSRLNDVELRGVHMIGTHLEEAELRNAFLQEADLSHAFLGSTETTYSPGDRFKPLEAADLRGVNFTDATLKDAFMVGVNMSPNEWGPPTSKYPEKYRELDHTELIRADIRDATLWEADLRGAVLNDADFANAVLRGAKLNGAGLTDPQYSVDFTGAKLDYADFTGAFLNGANFTDVTGKVAKSAIATFTDARLNDANFTGAKLGGAVFTRARLEGANFTDATVDGADFTDAKGIPAEQLEQQAKSLEGATTPNGQKYEDWLKSKGNGENSGSS